MVKRSKKIPVILVIIFSGLQDFLVFDRFLITFFQGFSKEQCQQNSLII